MSYMKNKTVQIQWIFPRLRTRVPNFPNFMNYFLRQAVHYSPYKF